MPRRLLRSVRCLAVALPLLAVGACAADRPTAPVDSVDDVTFAPSLNVDLAASTPLQGGVYARDLVVGEGAAIGPNSQVTAHYTLWLSDGRLIERSPDDTPLAFRLGRGSAIPGFEIGLIGMQVGGRRQILIPPAYGYGARGNGTIPGFAVLVFEVEIVDVE